MTHDHIFVPCEYCRKHGKCKRERTAFRMGLDEEAKP